MWKYCDFEICPWHQSNTKRQLLQSSARHSDKNNIRNKKSESISERQLPKCDQQDEEEIDACRSAKIIPSCESKTNEGKARNDTRRTKDKSEQINEPEATDISVNSTQKKSSSGKRSRPKTAPASVQTNGVTLKILFLN